MKQIVNSIQMKAIDNYTIEQIGIPSMVLMERAALSVVECIKEHTQIKNKILAVCGYGNNGGDGIAAARILTMQGFSVDILMIGDEQKASKQALEQLKIARNLGISINNNINLNEYTIIIDALFGIGLSKPISGQYETIINEMNTGNHLVFSVDIPSGLSADTAAPFPIAVRADYTITFGLMKQGLLLFPGCEYAGNVIVADIGFPTTAIDSVKPQIFSYDKSDLRKLPERKAHSNKGTFGKVLIVAGSTNISGACFFSAKAAYRTGAGLVKIVTVSDNKTVMQTLLPEALLTTYDPKKIDTETIDLIKKDIEWASVIVFGPGVGVNNTSNMLLDILRDNAKVPIIIDADGINLLAKRLEVDENQEKLHVTYKDDTKKNQSTSKNDNLSERIEKLKDYLPEHSILTPHLLELSRLLKIPLDEIKDNLLLVADYCTRKNNLIFAIKDARTIVVHEEKRYINTSGNDGMATGGTGDVLTGVIAGLIAQGLSQYEASTLGVYIHGLAGDEALNQKGNYGLIASDVIDALPKILRLYHDM